MHPTPPPLDIVSVLIALATLVFSPAVAAVVAPQVVIIIGATLGAVYGASRREPGTRTGTLGYIVGMVVLALLVTVPVAEVLSSWTGINLHWLLGPAAALIAGLEPDWLMAKARALLGRRIDGGAQ